MHVRRRGHRRVSLGVAALTAAALVSTVTLATATEAPAAAPTLRTTAAWRSNGLQALGVGSPSPNGVDVVAAAPASSAGAHRWADMVRYAELDLHQLAAANGAVAAGAAPHWAYTWPRDGAFSVAAMLATGGRAEALQTLGFLRDVQDDDGGFEARYRMDGSGVPDDRQPQADGAGWALWALGQVVAMADSEASARRQLAPLRPLLDRATRFALGHTGAGRRLPAPSPDYWEVGETAVTLGTAAALLAGLRASSRVYAVLGLPDRAHLVGTAADRFERLIQLRFGPGGYQRYEGWGGHDAAICLLMPPFAARPPAAVVHAWRAYQREAGRTAGGLAPGSGWKQDGVSWTPETALVAYTAAASGRHDTAARWLDWLDDHRTSWGSLPEKVLADGSPAGPAPLGWTAAVVLLTTAELSAP